MTAAQIQAGLQSMGLLDPLPVQIGRFWKDALHGDLGVSHIYKVNVPVTEILAQKLPISIQMGVLAMLLSLVLGIPLGLVMGRCKNRWPDKLGTALIVLANMLFKQLPTSTKICTASLALLPEVQERSARDLGAGRLAVLRDVVFPALRPAFLSCFV